MDIFIVKCSFHIYVPDSCTGDAGLLLLVTIPALIFEAVGDLFFTGRVTVLSPRLYNLDKNMKNIKIYVTTIHF